MALGKEKKAMEKSEQEKALRNSLKALGFDPNQLLNKNGKLKVEEFTSVFNSKYGGAEETLSAILNYNKTASQENLEKMKAEVNYAPMYEKMGEGAAATVESTHGDAGAAIVEKANAGNLQAQRAVFILSTGQAQQAHDQLAVDLGDSEAATQYMLDVLEAKDKEALAALGAELSKKGVSAEGIQQLEDVYLTSKALDATVANGDAAGVKFIMDENDIMKIHDYVVSKGYMEEFEWNSHAQSAASMETQEEAGEIMDEPILMLIESIQRMYENKQLSEEEQKAWEAVRDKMAEDEGWVSTLDEPDMLSNHLGDELKAAKRSKGALELQQIIAGVVKANQAQMGKVLGTNEKVRGAVVRALQKCAE